MSILLFSPLSCFLQQALCGRSLSVSLPFCFSCCVILPSFIDSEIVSGLSWSVDHKSLKEAFSSFGDVTEVTIVYDKDSGRSRGFGFVIFSNEDDAKCAKDAMDGKALLGRPLRINFALEKARGVPVVVPRLSDIGHVNRH
ncbi:Glycine-rich RNA-binding protein 4, mitochondrial [Glycine soja]|uniref:RRM domain-containing protein n=1 Tax=Glycine max TaxID=3847 RepID=K7L325_SOYBN|nr:Glycine-rich RNA-binding protein 4, mitochondrial [Glycine max]